MKISSKKRKPKLRKKSLKSSIKQNVKTVKHIRPPVITCYTDGSYSRESDTGGFCTYLECEGVSVIISGNEYHTTVNRMEIRAVLEALKAVQIRSVFLIHSDSMYVVNTINNNWIRKWISKGWKTEAGTPVANKDLWLEIFELMQHHCVKMIWVKGHSGIEGNELCDEVAQWQMRSLIK